MVQDRGSIKWTSLMLPEHVELLKSIWNEDKKVSKPILDEQELEVFNSRLAEAYEQHLPVHIAYYKHAQIIETEGMIQKFDQLNRKVYLKEVDGELLVINFCDICSVK